MELTTAVNVDFPVGNHEGQHQIGCFIALTHDSNLGEDCVLSYTEIPSIVGTNTVEN